MRLKLGTYLIIKHSALPSLERQCLTLSGSIITSNNERKYILKALWIC